MLLGQSLEILFIIFSFFSVPTSNLDDLFGDVEDATYATYI